MSRTVYNVKEIQCDRCEKEMIIEVTAVDNSRGNDPKIRYPDQEEWDDNIHCECGFALSPEASRYGPHGYTVVDPFVDRVTADELEESDPDFSSLF